MTGAWKTRKTKPRFPFVSHSPWKSLRDSHIPTAPATRGKVENQKQVSHFPTCCLMSLNQPQEKEAWRRIASLPPPGSFFNEKMLQMVDWVCVKSSVSQSSFFPSPPHKKSFPQVPAATL